MIKINWKNYFTDHVWFGMVWMSNSFAIPLNDIYVVFPTNRGCWVVYKEWRPWIFKRVGYVRH